MKRLTPAYVTAAKPGRQGLSALKRPPFAFRIDKALRNGVAFSETVERSRREDAGRGGGIGRAQQLTAEDQAIAHTLTSACLTAVLASNAPVRKVTRSIHEGARDLARDIASTDAYVT